MERNLTVVYNREEDIWHVVNPFDGVIVGSLYTKVDAEDFAISEEENEKFRISREYFN
jgi:hypothetical protein